MHVASFVVMNMFGQILWDRVDFNFLLNFHSLLLASINDPCMNQLMVVSDYFSKSKILSSFSNLHYIIKILFIFMIYLHVYINRFINSYYIWRFISNNCLFDAKCVQYLVTERFFKLASMKFWYIPSFFTYFLTCCHTWYCRFIFPSMPLALESAVSLRCHEPWHRTKDPGASCFVVYQNAISFKSC